MPVWAWSGTIFQYSRPAGHGVLHVDPARFVRAGGTWLDDDSPGGIFCASCGPTAFFLPSPSHWPDQQNKTNQLLLPQDRGET